MSAYQELQAKLRLSPKKWLVTGVAGFIGSNLLETLLNLDQHVVGLDNFSTGHEKNLAQVEMLVGPKLWKNFRFIEGDIRKLADCKCACHEADLVLHQAALGSVPRSMLDPIASHDSNVTGFLNMLVAARDAKVKRFVYASSRAIFGDHPELAKSKKLWAIFFRPMPGQTDKEITPTILARFHLESVGWLFKVLAQSGRKGYPRIPNDPHLN